MTTLGKIVIIILVTIIALFIVGAVENHRNNPLKNCTEFKLYTEYRGYDCGDKKVYVPQ